MRTKLLISTCLVVLLCLSEACLYAQDVNTINVINQYYHNWLGGVEDVYVEGDLAYIACDDDGLRIININNLDAIYDVGQYVVEGAMSITVDGDYAFLGAYTGNIYIIDISNPETPVEIFSDTSHYAIYEIEIIDNTAFLCQYNGLTILDISNISEPQTLWSSTGISSSNAIEIRGNIAYVASEYPGLVIMDITDLSSPEILHTYQPQGYNFVNGVDVQGNYAYLASGWNGMEVFDLSTHQVVARIDSLVWAFRIEVVDNFAYMTYGDPDCPLAIIDISDPLLPQTTGIYYPPEDLINFTIVENIAYMADFRHGLRMVDITVPQEPVENHVYSRYGLDQDVIVRGDYAYVKEDIKFKIIDISDMQNPFETGYYEFDWGYNDIHLVGDIAFLSKCSYNCLYALDISDPYSPEVIDIYHEEGNDVHYRMRLYGNYAYIVENFGLEIVDISNPAEMTHAGNYYEYIGNAQIEISDHYLFLKSSSYQAPLKVFDITDPLSPVFVTSYSLANHPVKMEAANGYLHVITQRELLVFDITDFTNWQPITEVEVFADEGYLTDIEIEGSNVYLTSANNGLYLYDLSDPTNPINIANSATPGNACGVFIADDIAYIADGSNLGFYDCSDVTGIEDEYHILPSSFALISNYPNPFNTSTNIRLELPFPAHVQLDVFDLLGRKVTTLADSKFNAGSHIIKWNGTSITGQPVTSGRYYIKVVSDNHTASLPVMLLK